MKPIGVLLALFLLQFGVYQYITSAPYIHGSPGKTFNSITSYDIGYVSFIRQSANGHWSILENRTTTPAPRVYAYPLFVALGKIAAITRMDPQDIYFMSKIVGALISFMVAYMLVVRFFPPKIQGIALVLILGIEIGPYLAPWGWESALFAQGIIVRHFGLPHHTIGEAVAFLFFYFYYQKQYVPLSITGMLAAFMLLPYTLLMYFVCLISLGIVAIHRKTIRSYVLASTIGGVAVAIPALFYRYQFSLGPPWNNFYTAEKLWYPTHEILLRYLSSLIFYVPFFILFAVCIGVVWKHMTSKLQDMSIVGVVWLVMPLVLLPLLPFTGVPLANFRIIDTYVYIFAGVVAAVGYYAFFELNIFKGMRMFVNAIVIAICFYSIWTTYIWTKGYVEKRSLQWSNIYIGNDNWRAIEFFSQIQAGSGVLALQHFGDIIADQADVRVYVGMTPGYSDWAQKVTLAAEFYTGTLSDDQAGAFLKNNDIAYVFFGPMEQFGSQKLPLYPSTLTPVFQSGNTTVYMAEK